MEHNGFPPLHVLQVDTPDVVVGVLLAGLVDKKPKVPPACVGILTKALQLFGPSAMPLKDIKGALPGAVVRIYVGEGLFIWSQQCVRRSSQGVYRMLTVLR